MTVETFPRIEWLVDRAAARTPDAIAVIDADSRRRWTYAALRAEMDRRAAALVAYGLAPGSVVLVNAPTHDHVLIAWLACCRADLIFMPVTPKIAPPEIADLARRARACVVLTPDGQPHPVLTHLPVLPLDFAGASPDSAFDEALRRSQEGDADATTLLLTTSGTTSRRTKIVQQSHRSNVWLPERMRRWPEAEIVMYLPRPNTLSDRFVAALLSLGATAILSTTTDPTRMETEMAALGATHLTIFPSVLRLLVRLPPPPPSLHLRRVQSGAAPLTPALLAALQARYAGVTVGQDYGSTEAGSMMGATYPDTPPGSIGTPYPGIIARIVAADGSNLPDSDIGEIIIRTPGLIVATWMTRLQRRNPYVTVGCTRAISAIVIRTGSISSPGGFCCKSMWAVLKSPQKK